MIFLPSPSGVLLVVSPLTMAATMAAAAMADLRSCYCCSSCPPPYPASPPYAFPCSPRGVGFPALASSVGEGMSSLFVSSVSAAAVVRCDRRRSPSRRRGLRVRRRTCLPFLRTCFSYRSGSNRAGAWTWRARRVGLEEWEPGLCWVVLN